MRTSRFGALLCALSLTASPLPAWAEEGEWSGSLAGGIGAQPEFLGSNDFEPTPYVAGHIAYDRYFLQAQGKELSLGVNLTPGLAMGAMLDVTSGRDDSIKNERVGRLAEIDDAIEVGGFVSYSWHGVLSTWDELTLDATYLFDVSDTHEGTIGSAGLSYGRTLGSRWSIGGGVRLTYVDEDYGRTYFGITPEGSAASGLAAFNAGSGIRDVGFGLQLGYAINENWSVELLGSYKQLLGDAKDSPIVDQEGSASQVSGAIAIGYRF